MATMTHLAALSRTKYESKHASDSPSKDSPTKEPEPPAVEIFAATSGALYGMSHVFYAT